MSMVRPFVQCLILENLQTFICIIDGLRLSLIDQKCTELQ